MGCGEWAGQHWVSGSCRHAGQGRAAGIWSRTVSLLRAPPCSSGTPILVRLVRGLLRKGSCCLCSRFCPVSKFLCGICADGCHYCLVTLSDSSVRLCSVRGLLAYFPGFGQLRPCHCGHSGPSLFCVFVSYVRVGLSTCRRGVWGCAPRYYRRLPRVLCQPGPHRHSYRHCLTFNFCQSGGCEVVLWF